MAEPKRDAVDLRPRKPVLYHLSPGSFLWSLLDEPEIKLPVWKILTPRPGTRQGAIYYIADGKHRLHVFRGTYGYSGIGPH